MDRPKSFYIIEQYFAIEHIGYARYEYSYGDFIRISDTSPEHNQIAENIYQYIKIQLMDRNLRAKAFTMGTRVKNPGANEMPFTPYFHPDVSVVCGEVKTEKLEGFSLLTTPSLLVEVLSPDSEERDKGYKLEMYKLIPSLKEYLIVAQDKPELTHYIKQRNGEWIPETITSLKTTITLSSTGCRLSMRDIYENIEFIRQV